MKLHKIRHKTIESFALFLCMYFAAGAAMALTFKSTAFADGGEIPSQYTCEGKDISPPLSWEGVPDETKSLVLIVDDPDAPDPRAPKMTWVHWVVYNIPPDTSGFPENVIVRDMAAGIEEGINDWKRTGYGGPCPPVGRHRYFFKLYALDTALTGLRKPDKQKVEAAMVNHVIVHAEFVGTFEKSR